jgi:hypothetical protein
VKFREHSQLSIREVPDPQDKSQKCTDISAYDFEINCEIQRIFAIFLFSDEKKCQNQLSETEFQTIRVSANVFG